MRGDRAMNRQAGSLLMLHPISNMSIPNPFIILDRIGGKGLGSKSFTGCCGCAHFKPSRVVGWIQTTVGFSQPEVGLAREHGLALIDGEALLLFRRRSYALISERRADGRRTRENWRRLHSVQAGVAEQADAAHLNCAGLAHRGSNPLPGIQETANHHASFVEE
jgi:hypothetical protein